MSAFDHPWLGGIYGDDEIAAILSPEADLKRMLQIEAAWSRALGAEDIAREVEGFALAPSDLRDGTARDGVPVPDLVRRIRAHVSEPKRVHTGLTSQDVIDTSTVLALREAFAIFGARLTTLEEALRACASAQTGQEVMAQTRMQPALPTTADRMIGLWAAPLPDLSAQLHVAQTYWPVQWGGPIGQRDVPDAEAVGHAFADGLGLKDPGEAWHTDRTVMVDAAGLMSKITGALGKIGQDVALMASRGDIVLSGGGGSSAMPHKQNPVLAETLVTLARYNAVALGGVHQALVHEQHRSGAAWGLEHLILPDMLRSTGASLLRAHALLGRIERIGSPA